MQDPTLTQWLNEEGISFEFHPFFPLAKINRAKSKENQARLDQAIDEWRVMTYAEAMKRGTQFPAMVGYIDLESDNGAVILADGNQRLAAADSLGFENFDLYILDVKDQAARDHITRSINMLRGWGTSKAELTQHAIWLHEQHGTPIIELSKRFGLNDATLSLDIRVAALRREMEQNGIRTTSFGKGVIGRFASVQNTVVLKEIADITNRAKLTADEVSRLVSEVNATRSSEAEQVALVKSFAERPEIKTKLTLIGAQRHNGTGKPTKSMQARNQVYAHIGGLQRIVDDYKHLAAVHIVEEEEIEKITTLWNKLRGDMYGFFARTSAGVTSGQTRA